MKHIKQGNNECFPTVLAMLSDTDVNKVIADGHAINANVQSWSDMLARAEQSGDCDLIEDAKAVYRALARKYAPYLIEHTAPISVNDCIEGKRYIAYSDFMRLTKTRKGAVILCSRFRSQPCAHIAAFENGLIYDGNLDGPIKAHDYYKFLATETFMCPYAVVSEY